MRSIASVIILVVLLLGCSNKNNDNNQDVSICSSTDDSFVGCWIDTGCYQSQDDGIWTQGIYNFLVNGGVESKHNKYSDASCQIKVGESNFVSMDVTYEQSTLTTLAEGVGGWPMVFTSTNNSNQIIEFNLSINGNNNLCSSQKLQFSNGIFIYNPLASVSIDYTNCLEKYDES